MNEASQPAVTIIARIIRDNDLPTAASILAERFRSASESFIGDIGEIADLLGADSRLVLDVALTEATVYCGEAAGRCKVGSRRRKAHLSRWEALCAAHDALLAAERAA